MEPTQKLLIDLHCDTLYECGKRGLGLKNSELHFSLDRLERGFSLCQFMAVFVPDSLRGGAAERHFLRHAGIFAEQVKLHAGKITALGELTGIQAALEKTRFAAVLTIEGAAALNGRLENIARFYDMGVRLITLTWNGENELAGGVGTRLGLKPFGRLAVAEMERLGIVVDASHLSDRAFWDLCETATKPFVASHSNSRAVCAHPRNLTDEMFREIARRGGLVGLNFYRCFLRRDGANGDVTDILRHVHHFLELNGEDTLCIGSDFDGCDVPDYLNGIGGYGYLAAELEKSGVSSEIISKILFKNANNYFNGRHKT